MAEEQNSILDIQNEILEDYKNACYGKNDDIRIKLPIKKLNSFCDGNTKLKVYIELEELNFNNFKLIIISDFNQLFRVSSNNYNDNYNILYKNKLFYNDPKQLSEEELHNLNEDEAKLNIQLSNIDFEKLYDFIDNLKYCEITNKLRPRLLTKEYINKYIADVNECSVCYTDTTHKIKCNHTLCIDCCYKIMKEKRSGSVCPICRTNIWH